MEVSVLRLITFVKNRLAPRSRQSISMILLPKSMLTNRVLAKHPFGVAVGAREDAGNER